MWSTLRMEKPITVLFLGFFNHMLEHEQIVFSIKCYTKLKKCTASFLQLLREFNDKKKCFFSYTERIPHGYYFEKHKLLNEPSMDDECQ